jgi:hypothetical protein
VSDYDAASKIRSAITSEILRAAQAEGIDVKDRKPWRDSQYTISVAEPLAGIKYGLIARDVATRVIEGYIKYAREDGRTWLQIGQALGLAEDAESNYDVASAAYDHAAGKPSLLRTPSFFWSCPACGQGVTDYGPFTANPWDNESGHADGCARFAADVARYRADWGDDE